MKERPIYPELSAKKNTKIQLLLPIKWIRSKKVIEAGSDVNGIYRGSLMFFQRPSEKQSAELVVDGKIVARVTRTSQL